MPRKKPRVSELPTHEAIHKLFPRPVVEHAKTVADEGKARKPPATKPS